MSSIAEFGFVMPALIDEDGVIIADEARIAAAERLGMPEVPVIIAHQWGKAQVRTYTVRPLLAKPAARYTAGE
jgi:hypothetical protein